MNSDYAYAKIQGLNGETFLIQHVYIDYLKFSSSLSYLISSCQ